MVSLSILNRFCAPLIEALCPYREDECEVGSWGMVQWLKKHHLFQISLDKTNHWFRFHHIFRELLQSQLKRQYSPDEIVELHLKAGNWFAENGYGEEAVKHLKAGGASVDAEKINAQIDGAVSVERRIRSNSNNLADSLTVREQEILEQLVEGKTNKEIGEELYISSDTVKSHLKNIFQKIEVKSRLQAVTKARKLGFTG